MYVKTDETGRITATSQAFHLGDGGFEFDFPPDFDFGQQADWRIVNGTLAHDPLPEPEPEADPLAALSAENKLLKAQVQALGDRSDFLEDCIAEMAMQVYQ